MGHSRQRLRLLALRTVGTLARPAHPNRRPVNLPNLRILLIRPDHIGDLLFAAPALRVLRKALPEAHLACMVGPWGKAVVENNPHLDDIIVCEFPGFSRKPKGSPLAPYRLLHKWAGQLRPGHFDMAVVLRFDHWWGALLACLAGIPCRVGYAIPECRPFLTQALPYDSQRHEVRQNLTLIEAAVQEAGGQIPEDSLPLEFSVTPADQVYAARYLAERGVLPGQAIVAIHPGAGAPVKLWSTESWAQAADALVERWAARIVITGSRDELDLAWAVYAHMRADAIVAAGDTTLGQLAALFGRCRLVLGPDCGPLHLATAVGTPTVHLHGPVDALKFGPWGGPEKHLVVKSDRQCIPCNRLDYLPQELPDHSCVCEIPVQTVLEAVKRLLATS